MRLLTRYGRYVRLTESRLAVGRYLFRRHGGKVVFYGRFISVLRTYAYVVNTSRGPLVDEAAPGAHVPRRRPGLARRPGPVTRHVTRTAESLL
jgi:hypothetical protein